jgi:prolyl-tRNA editing enzyme YbaK/EbsC (Cys-tRNA(Pro) deacylase)
VDVKVSSTDGIKQKAAVKRVIEALHEHGLESEVHVLSDSARTAQEAATALGIEVGQIASSLIFKLADESPLLIITSGRHRVDTELVAKTLGVEKLGRVDADYVKEKSGFSIGGVSPLGWISKPEIILIDEALNDYDVVWAAAGHPHAVYPTTYNELITCTGAKPMVVGD